jgi:hypothetical protein
VWHGTRLGFGCSSGARRLAVSSSVACTTGSTRAGKTAVRWRDCARVCTHVHDEAGVPLVAKGSTFVSLARRTRVRRLMGERGGTTCKQQFRIAQLKIDTAS